jgi:hypothetical protein
MDRRSDGDIPEDAIPPPPPFPAELSMRRLSDHGRTLLREGLSMSNSPGHRDGPEDGTFVHDLPTTPLPRPTLDRRKSEAARFNEAYHAEATSSDEDEVDVAETHLVNIPKGTIEARLELITTEQPFRPLLAPLHNPVDQSQVVPEADKTFSKEPYIGTWLPVLNQIN